MTFVDYAELVWRRLADGATQQRVADGIRWSRAQVSQYAMLQKIDPEAWRVVATSFSVSVADANEGDVAEVATGVATPFTEGLLRNILDFANLQQIDAGAWKIVGATFQQAAPSADDAEAPAFGATAPFSERLLRDILDLDPEAWRVVATAFQNTGAIDDDGDVAEIATGVATPFSENLLRNILDLEPGQQGDRGAGDAGRDQAARTNVARHDIRAHPPRLRHHP